MTSLRSVFAKPNVQAGLAYLLVGTFCGLAVATGDIPEAVTAAVGMVIGYYFRSATSS